MVDALGRIRAKRCIRLFSRHLGWGVSTDKKADPPPRARTQWDQKKETVGDVRLKVRRKNGER